MTTETGIAIVFNEFLTNIGPELAKKIPTASKTFESFLNKIHTTMPAVSGTTNDCRRVFRNRTFYAFK